MRRIEVTPEARADIDQLLGWSEALFGPVTADRYRRLIEAGLRAYWKTLIAPECS